MTAARTVVTGGALVFLGSLLPFISSTDPEAFQLNAAPQDTATLFGIVLAAIGCIMLANSVRAKVISGIVTLLVVALTELELVFIAGIGIVGFDTADGFGGTTHVNFSLHVGIILSILGLAVAGIGAIFSFRR